MEQYRVVCNEFLRFSITKGVNTYSDQIMADYLEAVTARCDSGEICPEYLRFQKRAIRMLSSLAAAGCVDFSRAHKKKYIVFMTFAGCHHRPPRDCVSLAQLTDALNIKSPPIA